MRRKASQGLAVLATNYPERIHYQLQLCGYLNQTQYLQQVVYGLYDQRMKIAGEKIARCFEVTAAIPIPPITTTNTTNSNNTNNNSDSISSNSGNNSSNSSLTSSDNEEEEEDDELESFLSSPII